MPQETLKSCPFCGGLAGTLKAAGVFQCCCCDPACLANATYATKEEAIAAWNTRTPAPAPQEAAPTKCNARDAFLSLTDPSNWDDIKGDELLGYKNAMKAVHETVIDFWGELSKQTPAAPYRDSKQPEWNVDKFNCGKVSDRIKELMENTAYPESQSVYNAMSQLANEFCQGQFDAPTPAPAAMREGVLVKRADGIKDWLYESGSTCFKDQKHLEDGTPEREYWHYGYMMALIDLLRVGEE